MASHKSTSFFFFFLLAFYISRVFCQGAITVDYPSGGQVFAIGDYVEIHFVFTEPGVYPFTITLIQDSINPGALAGPWNTTQSETPSSFSATAWTQVPVRAGALPLVDNMVTPYYIVVSPGDYTINNTASDARSQPFYFKPPTDCPTYWYQDGRTVQGIRQYHGCSLAAAGAWGALAAEPKSIAQMTGLVGLIVLAIAYLV